MKKRDENSDPFAAESREFRYFPDEDDYSTEGFVHVCEVITCPSSRAVVCTLDGHICGWQSELLVRESQTERVKARDRLGG